MPNHHVKILNFYIYKNKIKSYHSIANITNILKAIYISKKFGKLILKNCIILWFKEKRVYEVGRYEMATICEIEES